MLLSFLCSLRKFSVLLKKYGGGILHPKDLARFLAPTSDILYSFAICTYDLFQISCSNSSFVIPQTT